MSPAQQSPESPEMWGSGPAGSSGWSEKAEDCPWKGLGTNGAGRVRSENVVSPTSPTTVPSLCSMRYPVHSPRFLFALAICNCAEQQQASQQSSVDEAALWFLHF